MCWQWQDASAHFSFFCRMSSSLFLLLIFLSVGDSLLSISFSLAIGHEPDFPQPGPFSGCNVSSETKFSIIAPPMLKAPGSNFSADLRPDSAPSKQRVTFTCSYGDINSGVLFRQRYFTFSGEFYFIWDGASYQTSWGSASCGCNGFYACSAAFSNMDLVPSFSFVWRGDDPNK